jgi:hypothetical protein
MSERFLKFIPSDEAFWLMQHKPNAFYLLSQIANTARRSNGGPDGLMVGQCHLKASYKYGLTEGEYRAAKKMLISRNHIKIIETNRTRQKSTTGTTTESTIVELISSTVYDINSETNDNRNDDRTTTERQLNDNKQEGIRKKKNDKKEEQPHTPSLSKIKFREFVELTQVEHDSLLAKHGSDFLNLMMDKLDSFKGSTGKVYKSDFHTMKEGGWVFNQVKKDSQETKKPEENTQKLAEQFCKEFPEHENGRGWRCYFYHDKKKDQRGILFEPSYSYLEPFFVAFSDGQFQQRCEDFIRTKNMREKNKIVELKHATD